MRHLANPPPRPTGHPSQLVRAVPVAGERREAIWCRDVAGVVAFMLATTPSALFWQYVTHPSLVEHATAFLGFHVDGHDVVIIAVDDAPHRLPAFAVTVDDKPAYVDVRCAHHPIAVLADAITRAVRSAPQGPDGEVRT
ncbi:hypothetical protein [Longispora urticae]